jgi:hypothetical protein
VCQSILQSTAFFSFLLCVDQDLAQEACSRGCSGCGGRLHRAEYPRKPRGAQCKLDPAYRRRFSFCCAACRRRTTPYSVRFLGRRVYLAVVMTLACALSAGLSVRRAGVLTDDLHIPLRTLQRWRRWWLVEFVQTPFWQAQRALFMPTVEESTLPESLRLRFQSEGDWGSWPLLLRFLTPLSSRAANGFGEGR